jgi:predicted transposase YdaD
MTVLRESPWYQEILKEGLEKGEKQGLQQGETNLILRQLRRRFGEIDLPIKQSIQKLSIPQLELLGESLLDFSKLQDLLNWLEKID